MEPTYAPGETTPELNEKYMRHVRAFDSARGKARVAHALLARGYYKILTERALAGDGSAAFGMPHWMVLSNEQIERMG